MKNLAPTDAAHLEAIETREWLESLDYVLDQGDKGRVDPTARRAARPGARLRLPGAVRGHHAVHQHHPARRAGAVSGRPRDRAPHQEPHPLERAGDGRARQPRVGRHRRPHLDLRVGGDALRGRRSTTSSAARTPAHDADIIYFQGHASPGIYARAFLEGRLTEAAPPQLPPRAAAGRRAVVLSAPVADAGLLGVPDGLDGPRPAHGDLPGALHALPRESRPEGARPTRRSGRSSATARPTSRKRSARSRSPRARSSTT